MCSLRLTDEHLLVARNSLCTSTYPSCPQRYTQTSFSLHSTIHSLLSAYPQKCYIILNINLCVFSSSANSINLTLWEAAILRVFCSSFIPFSCLYCVKKDIKTNGCFLYTNMLFFGSSSLSLTSQSPFSSI